LVRLPKSGEVWPEAERKLWLELLSGSFKLIYKDVGHQERARLIERARVDQKLGEDDEVAN
jgi:hypothetical protein